MSLHRVGVAKMICCKECLPAAPSGTLKRPVGHYLLHRACWTQQPCQLQKTLLSFHCCGPDSHPACCSSVSCTTQHDTAQRCCKQHLGTRLAASSMSDAGGFNTLLSSLKSRPWLNVSTGVPNVAHSQCMLAMLHSLDARCYLHDHHACKTQLQHCHDAGVCCMQHVSLAMLKMLS